MQHLASESPSIGIYGGTGGNGGGGGGHGGGGGVGLGPSFGGMQFLIQNPQLDSSHPLAMNNGPSSPSQAVAASFHSSALGMAATATQTPHASQQNLSSPQAAVYSESVNYCSQLLRQGRGFSLYVPRPQPNLPAEYRRRGVAIGDVGRVAPEGSFDFFFNIYLPANHPINANVPENFVPLSPYDPIDVSHHDFDPGDFVSSPSVTEISNEYPEFPGGQFVFSCREPTGAILTLPHGAQLEKLKNLESMRQYAAKHAESWYKYVNGTRGRGLVNGNLYLVTGCEKPRSWGMASFHDVSLQNEFQLSFRPTQSEDEGYRYRWRGNFCRRKQADLPPQDGTPLNQTTFIHAFAISVGEGIWEKLFGVEVCQLVDSSTFLDKSGRSFVPYGSQGSSFLWSLFFGNGTFSGGKQCSRLALAPGDGIVTDAFPTPKIIHPSEIIHERIFREVPRAAVVITHDNDWHDVFKNDGMQTPGKTALELQQAIFDRFEILEEDGAVCLRAKSDTATSRTAATITVEEKCPVHGAIVDDLRDNLNLPSQASPREISAAELEEEEDQNNTPESSEHSFSDESAYDLFEYHHSQADDYSMSDPYDSHSAADNYPMSDPYDSSAAGEYLMSDPYDSNNGYGSSEESKDLGRKFPVLSIPIAPSRNSKSTAGPEERRPKKGKDDYVKRPENAFILFRRQYCNSLSFPAASSSSTFPQPPKADPKGTRKQRQANFSKSISTQWKALPPEERTKWEKLAREKKREHETLHPGYVYRPMRGRRKSSALAFGSAFATIPTAPVLAATSFASTPAVPALPSHSTRTSLEFVVPAHHTSAGNFAPQLAPFAPHHTKPAKSAFSPGHGEIVMLARPDHAFLSPDLGLLRSSSDATSWRRSHVRKMDSEDMWATLFPHKGGASDLVQESQFLSPVVRHQHSVSSGSSAGLDDSFFSTGSGSSHRRSEGGLQLHPQLSNSRIQGLIQDNFQMDTDIQ